MTSEWLQRIVVFLYLRVEVDELTAEIGNAATSVPLSDE